MEYIPKISVNKAYTFLKKNYNKKSLNQKSSKDNNILEPFSVMLKLSLLFFKPEGTKLSIHSNTIIFQEPDFIQGVNRYFNNDKSIDITKLYIPILKCLSRFELNDNYKFLFNISINGLEKLKKNYMSDYSTLTTINSYIALIKSYIGGFNLNIDNCFVNNSSDLNIWNDEDICLVINCFNKLNEETSDNLKKKYMRVIIDIAELKEYIAVEMVNKAVEYF